MTPRRISKADKVDESNLAVVLVVDSRLLEELIGAISCGQLGGKKKKGEGS